MRYKQLSITERELIAINQAGEKSLCQLAPTQEQWSPEQIAARLKLENYPIQIRAKAFDR